MLSTSGLVIGRWTSPFWSITIRQRERHILGMDARVFWSIKSHPHRHTSSNKVTYLSLPKTWEPSIQTDNPWRVLSFKSPHSVLRKCKNIHLFLINTLWGIVFLLLMSNIDYLVQGSYPERYRKRMRTFG